MLEKITAAIKLGKNLLDSKRAIRHLLSDEEKITTLDGRSVSKQILTAEERAKPYARYFDIPMSRPAQQLIDAIANGPIDSSVALSPYRINDLLKPGYLASEIGYCQLSDGTGYISSIVQMPDVTAAMFNWWFCWHPLEPLRYKIWNPKVHYNVKISAADRTKLLDESVPMHLRVVEVLQEVTEDIGLGAMKADIEFTSPDKLGFNMELFNRMAETAVGSVLGGKAVHLLRKSASGPGNELKTRFWFPAGTPVSVLKHLNYHLLEEFTHLGEILPLLYKEFGPEVK